MVCVSVPKLPLQFISPFSYPQSSDSQNCRFAEHTSYVTAHCAANHVKFILIPSFNVQTNVLTENLIY